MQVLKYYVRRLMIVAGASIDKDGCIRWVGETYLEAMAPSSAASLGRSEYLNAWKDHLPESWTGDVALSKLPVCGHCDASRYGQLTLRRKAHTSTLTRRRFASSTRSTGRS